MFAYDAAASIAHMQIDSCSTLRFECTRRPFGAQTCPDVTTCALSEFWKLFAVIDGGISVAYKSGSGKYLFTQIDTHAPGKKTWDHKKRNIKFVVANRTQRNMYT